MNVISMVREILCITNPVVRESALPDFALATKNGAKSVRVSAFSQLDGMFKGYVIRRRDEKMDVFGHQDEGVQLKAAFATVVVKSFQE